MKEPESYDADATDVTVASQLDTTPHLSFMLPSCFYPTIHSSITPPREFDLILPKLSAAILAMAMLGSPYAASILERDTSLEQWVMMSGAPLGPAALVGASPDDRTAHSQPARTHSKSRSR